MQELNGIKASLARLQGLTAQAEGIRQQDLPCLMASVNRMAAFYHPEQEEAVAERLGELDIETASVMQALDTARDELRRLVQTARDDLDRRLSSS